MPAKPPTGKAEQDKKANRDQLFTLVEPGQFLQGAFSRYLLYNRSIPSSEGLDCLRSFEANWGRAMPNDLSRCMETLAEAGWPDLYQWKPGFTALCLLASDESKENLIETIIANDQRDYRETGLVELFSGAVCIGQYPNGDRYMYGLYEPEAGLSASPIYCYDQENQNIMDPVTSDLATLTYLTALGHAFFSKDILTRSGFIKSFAKLSNRVRTSWHFEQLRQAAGKDNLQPLALEAREQITRIAFKRSVWINYLLRFPDVVSVKALTRVFDPKLNQPVTRQIHDRWIRSAPQRVSVAVYALFREFFFQETERLTETIRVCKSSRSRLIRDAARLVEQLEKGRKELGAITDIQEVRKRFLELKLPVSAKSRETATPLDG